MQPYLDSEFHLFKDILRFFQMAFNKTGIESLIFITQFELNSNKKQITLVTSLYKITGGFLK